MNILMMVGNPGTTDARVMKQAYSLQRKGYSVSLYCRSAEGFCDHEVVNDVQVFRFNCFDTVSLPSCDDVDWDEVQSFAGSVATEHFKVGLKLKGLVAKKLERLEEHREGYKLKFESSDVSELDSLIEKSSDSTENELKIASDELSSVQQEIEQKTETRNKLVAEQGAVASYATAKTHGFLGRFFPKKIDKNDGAESNAESLRRELVELVSRRDQIRVLIASIIERRREDMTKARDQWRQDRQDEKDSFRLELEDMRTDYRASAVELSEARFYLNYFSFYYNLLNLDLDRKPDVIHAHDLFPVLGAVALGKKIDAKVVFDAHELEAERAPPLSVDRKTFILSMEKSLMPMLSHMITVSDSIAAEYHLIRGEKTAKPIVIFNAPDFECDAVDAYGDTLASLASLVDGTSVLGYTGALGREPRGVDNVIYALKYVPDLHLVNPGPRKLESDEWIMDCAKSVGVEERVHLIDPVPAKDVVPLMRSADIAVCAFQNTTLNHQYAMPNKIFEAILAEVPIAVSNLKDMKALVSELGVGVVMDQTDPKSIAGAFTKMLKNIDAYKLSMKSREILDDKYTWGAQSKKLSALYVSLTS